MACRTKRQSEGFVDKTWEEAWSVNQPTKDAAPRHRKRPASPLLLVVCTLALVHAPRMDLVGNGRLVCISKTSPSHLLPLGQRARACGLCALMEKKCNFRHTPSPQLLLRWGWMSRVLPLGWETPRITSAPIYFVEVAAPPLGHRLCSGGGTIAMGLLPQALLQPLPLRGKHLVSVSLRDRNPQLGNRCCKVSMKMWFIYFHQV